MTWILTCSGRVFDLQLAGPDDINLGDIATALSKINRFGGHTSRLYSVAEHSIHVSRIMEDHLAIGHPAALMAALLHDAHEAYVGDMATPLKDVLGPAWSAVESRIEHQVLRKFGVSAAAQAWRGHIKHADLLALATERRDLLPVGGPAWPCLHTIAPLDSLDLRRSSYRPDDWRDAFCDRFDELNVALAEARAVLSA